MKYQINLITKKSDSFFDKVLYFFLNYLRYILVITQLVVIGVLFFRFRIDQNIIDLKDSIDQKKEIISVVKPILAETEKFQNREQSIKQILAQQNTFNNSLNYLLSVFPASITLSSLEIQKEMITLEGIALDPQHLQAFNKKLRDEKKFTKVTLSEIRRQVDGYGFTLTLEKFKQ